MIVLSTPDDYDMTAAATLAHTTTATEPEGFAVFWEEFREEVAALPCTWMGTLDDVSVEMVVPSVREVRVWTQVTMPAQPPRGIVVALHGYADDVGLEEQPPPEAWTEQDLATVQLRVRGYPPSVMDIDDLRRGWILQGIESPAAWILRGAVADVIQACRCARKAIGPELPVMLHGESFGGGLAVIAAAQMDALQCPLQRLVISLPTFGDWPWRFNRYCNGAGGEVVRWIDAHRDLDRERFINGLLLFDASLHASAVRCPTLCKLAHLDDTVPAPAAAAIVNALGASETWTFETRYGHYDGGLADARRHALFERLHPDFFDPRRAPAELMSEWANRLQL